MRRENSVFITRKGEGPSRDVIRTLKGVLGDATMMQGGKSYALILREKKKPKNEIEYK